MSAPSVNQMRFLSSSALAKAWKFRLATSCSAAEAMEALRTTRLGRRLARPDDRDAAPGPLDGRAGLFGRPVHLDADARRDLALPEQTDAVAHAPDEPGRDQRLGIDDGVRIEPAGGDAAASGRPRNPSRKRPSAPSGP